MLLLYIEALKKIKNLADELSVNSRAISRELKRNSNTQTKS